MTDHDVRLAGVVGHPIGHTRSPKLYRYWLDQYQIEGYYVPLSISVKDFPDAIRSLPRLGFQGVNVTLPHKETALRLADRVSDRAALIGAANTITFQADGKIHADNTDGVGFIENLRRGEPSWRAADGPTLVLGAGGAARAVIAALLDAGVPEIILVNRTKLKAEVLRDAFGPKVSVGEWHAVGDLLTDAATVVNTTSLGMTGQPELKLPMDRLPPDAVVTDLVYSPLETELLAGAKARGCRTVDGLGMLLHQAVPGFERWFGFRPEVTPELRAAALA